MIQKMSGIAILSLAAAATVMAPSFAKAATNSEAPVTLIKSTPVPDVTDGDFDQFAVDFKRNHLFVSAEDHHSLELFDLKTGEHLQSISGVKLPHGLAYDAPTDELLVEDGGDSALIVLSAADYHRIARIPMADGSATGKGDSPDTGVYDNKNHLFYVGNGGASAKLDDSVISVFSPAAGRVIDEIKVPGSNLEGMAIDNANHLLYVNVRDKKQIAVIDLKTRQILHTWTAPDMNKNTGLALDPVAHRLFVVSRNPGMLYVFDVTNGNLVAQKPCANINDGALWDPSSKLLYVTATEGLSIFHQDGPDAYTELTRIPTNGAKTGILVTELGRLYVAHPHTNVDGAALLVYKLN
jgi:DNA-binding beta-propeller fold protein YncE